MFSWYLQHADGQVRFSRPTMGNEAMSVEFTSIAADVTDPSFLVSDNKLSLSLYHYCLSLSLLHISDG